ncbi:hypothetical protein A2U01_0116591, partial [Trifolium medium]|nr:hypothetical protein [Trifolium medium]
CESSIHSAAPQAEAFFIHTLVLGPPLLCSTGPAA